MMNLIIIKYLGKSGEKNTNKCLPEKEQPEINQKEKIPWINKNIIQQILINNIKMKGKVVYNQGD